MNYIGPIMGGSILLCLILILISMSTQKPLTTIEPKVDVAVPESTDHKITIEVKDADWAAVKEGIIEIIREYRGQ